MASAARSGSSRSSLALNSSATRPATRMVTRSATSAANAGRGAATRMVRPRSGRVLMSSAMSCTISGARPSVGSSSSSSRGCPSRARAMASICCSPPESWRPRCPTRSARRGSSSLTLSGVHCAAARSRRLRRPKASARCSWTVRPGNTRRPCGTRPTPERARRCAGWRVTSAPASSTRPEEVETRPDTVWMSVVLPAPLWPTTACTEPSGISRSRPCSTVPPS